jgi:kanamycin kinase
MPAGPPSRDIETHAVVRKLAAGYPIRAVWENELGGITFEVTGPHRVFVKWAPNDGSLDLDAEVARLSWATPFTPVPRVLAPTEEVSLDRLFCSKSAAVNGTPTKRH